MPEITIEQAELDRLTAAAEAGQSAAAALDQSQQDLTAAREAATTATNAYADQLRAANADLPADAIAGATVDELNTSRDRARAIADHAIEQHRAANPPASAETPNPATSGQAAAPPRTPPTVEGLRGADRIKAALEEQKGR